MIMIFYLILQKQQIDRSSSSSIVRWYETVCQYRQMYSRTTHARPFTHSPSSRHLPFTQYPLSTRSLMHGGQTCPHTPWVVVSHSTCPPLSPPPHAHSFVIGTAVIYNNILSPAEQRRKKFLEDALETDFGTLYYEDRRQPYREQKAVAQRPLV
jgi:hypothetical protein